MTRCTGPQLRFCADGELGAAQPYSLRGARAESRAAFGAGGEKSMAKALAALMLHTPSIAPSSSPALSLFLTSSGSRATWQRDPVPAPDSCTHRHARCPARHKAWAAGATKGAGIGHSTQLGFARARLFL